MRKKRVCFLLLLILLLLGSCQAKQPQQYVYIPCLSDGANEENILGISILDYDKEWHVEAPQKHVVIPIYDIPEGQKDFVVRFPENYTQTVEGFRCEVTFFQSEYEYNDLIQARVSVTNETDENMEYRYEVEKMWLINQTQESYIHNLHYRSYDCYTHVDAVVYEPLDAGEKIVIEYIFPCDPNVLCPEDDIVFRFALQLITQEGDKHVVELRLPVEVVKVGS